MKGWGLGCGTCARRTATFFIAHQSLLPTSSEATLLGVMWYKHNILHNLDPVQRVGGCSVWAGRILEVAAEAAGLRLACPALAAVAADGPGLRLEFLNLAAQLKFSVRLPIGAACSLGTRSKGIWSRPELGRR